MDTKREPSVPHVGQVVLTFEGKDLEEAVAKLRTVATSQGCEIGSIAINQRHDERIEVVAVLTIAAIGSNQRRAAVWVTVFTAVAAVFMALNGSVLWSPHPTVTQIVSATSWCFAWLAAIAYVWRKNGPSL